MFFGLDLLLLCEGLSVEGLVKLIFCIGNGFGSESVKIVTSMTSVTVSKISHCFEPVNHLMVQPDGLMDLWNAEIGSAKNNECNMTIFDGGLRLISNETCNC